MSQLAPPVEIYWVSRSPFAWRVLLTAEVKGIPYEGKLLEASKGELKTPEFLAINPFGRVPAIRDGNFTLHESLAIMVYLDCKHPNPPLFGRTAEEAGRIFQCISEFISDFGPSGQRQAHRTPTAVFQEQDRGETGLIYHKVSVCRGTPQTFICSAPCRVTLILRLSTIPSTIPDFTWISCSSGVRFFSISETSADLLLASSCASATPSLLSP